MDGRPRPVHSSADGHGGCLPPGAAVDSATGGTRSCLCEHLFSAPRGINSGRELLVFWQFCSTSGAAATPSSTAAVPVAFPAAGCEGSRFLRVLVGTCYFLRFKILAITVDVKTASLRSHDAASQRWSISQIPIGFRPGEGPGRVWRDSELDLGPGGLDARPRPQDTPCEAAAKQALTSRSRTSLCMFQSSGPRAP